MEFGLLLEERITATKWKGFRVFFGLSEPHSDIVACLGSNYTLPFLALWSGIASLHLDIRASRACEVVGKITVVEDSDCNSLSISLHFFPVNNYVEALLKLV